MQGIASELSAPSRSSQHAQPFNEKRPPYSPPVSRPSSPLPHWLQSLQYLSETLATAHTQAQVLDFTLTPAIDVLKAVSGTVLLLNEIPQTLTVAARQGRSDQNPWQDTPFTIHTPTGDALIHQQALYFEHAGELTAAYPELQLHTPAKATAILPLLLDGQNLGVLILDFYEPHLFTLEERHFLFSISRQCSLALSRTHLIAALQISTTRFQRLVDVSPIGIAMGTLDGRLIQVNGAYLQLLGYSQAQFEAGEMDWQALTPPEHQVQDQVAFALAVRDGSAPPYEKEMLTASGERIPLGITLLRYDDQKILGYVQDLRAYKAQQQVLRDEGHRLRGLVADRTTDLLTFVAFTEAASQTNDLGELAQLAMDTIATVLPGSVAVLYERQPDRWGLQHYTDGLEENLREELLRHGLPLDAPAVAAVERTRETIFLDGSGIAAQGIPHTEAFQAIAAYPLIQQDVVSHTLGIILAPGVQWDDGSKAVITAIGRSFSLLYDRVSTAQQLALKNEEAERRARALEAFVRFTTTVASTTDLEVLARTASATLRDAVRDAQMGFYLVREDTARPLFFSENMPPASIEAWQIGITLHTPLLQAALTRTGTLFADPHLHQDWSPDPEILSIRVYRQDGQPYAIFTTTTTQDHWTAEDKAIITSVGDGLGVALERLSSLAQLARQAERLEQTNAELQISNQELEAFSYSASHDLRTPVRHIQGFGELARQALERGQLDKLPHFLQVMREASGRMNAMIDAMLILSRIGRARFEVQPISLRKIVVQAQQDAQQEFPDRAVLWHSAELPIVQADPTTLQQALTNLLSNALKYQDGSRTAEIWIEVDERPTEVVVSVRDNGVGFNPEYANQLFGAFQRLHRQEEFEGTGIGLATVRRIIMRHGGQIWAKSSVGQGATFTFTLPK